MEREPRPISELVARQQQLSNRLEKKQNLFGKTIPAKIGELDPWTQTTRLIRLGRAGAWLERSISQVRQSLGSISEEINLRKGELLGKVQIYQGELETRRTQLVQMEGLTYIPANSIASFKIELGRLESQKETNPELKLGFSFLQEQPAPPAPTPPVEKPTPLEEISDEEKQKRKELLDVINSANLTNQEQKVLAAGIIYSEQNLGSNEDWAKLVYPDLPVKQAVANFEVRRRQALNKLTGKIELVTVWPDKRSRGGRAGYYLKLSEAPVGQKETKEAELALPVLPEMRINMTNFKVEIDGRLREVRGEIGRAILTNFEDMLGQRHITKSRVRELLKELGAIPGYPAGLAIRNLNRTLGSPLITEADPDRYILNANVTFVGGEATKEEPESAEKRKHQEAWLLYTKTLPDGQTIQIRGKITADCFDAVFSGSKENPIPSSRIKNWPALLRLKKILEEYGYTIIQPVPPQERAQGKTGFYYPEKIVQEKEAGLPEVEIPTREPVTIEKLQSELEELQTHRLSIVDKVSQGILDKHWLDEIDEEISQREAELRLRNLKPEDLEEGQAGGIGVLMREVPYVPTEEEKRSFRETALLSFIVTTMQANKLLLFEEIQAAMVPESHKRRGVQVTILQGYELKEVFHSALRKIREEAEIVNLRGEWNEDEKRLSEQLQNLIRNISGGDVEGFIRTVGRMIDAAERRFYRDFPPESGKVYKLTL